MDEEEASSETFVNNWFHLLCTHSCSKEEENGQESCQGLSCRIDGNERYRIWLKEENQVILSRDVIFQEKPHQMSSTDVERTF
ncbi:hypothetical protein AVEN_59721-1 [Araneus ventricosus]|uniref:Retroviral polymerase SH3-like domain-containing protein n=1 Tax=Araneus ventricosus TaxID=182803 RepID=A0A4Y2BQ26_ARAVE|nr:hypothetical protein AVEN_59721-1 [Araneus ventricosus]